MLSLGSGGAYAEPVRWGTSGQRPQRACSLPMQDDLSFKGVVFNEMKGVYSSPDSMNSRATQHALFPDNTYGDDSGGDPAAIPDLNFDE